MSGVQDPVKGLMVFRGQKPFSDWHSLQSVVSCVGRRRWPLLSNAGMSQQELQEAGEERRARRERFRDRQMERDTRRLP
nr:uncharacterized protein LOC128696567 isoform X3 [Cherax quadricarinatus]